jgi:hypothetical protein
MLVPEKKTEDHGETCFFLTACYVHNIEVSQELLQRSFMKCSWSRPGPAGPRRKFSIHMSLLLVS